MKHSEEETDPLFQVFEDLLEHDQNMHDENIQKEQYLDHGDELVNKTLASTFTLKVLIKEMEKRDIQPRGFYSEDVKILQTYLDEEYEETIRRKREERRIALEREEEDRKVRKRRELISSEMSEELSAVHSDIDFIKIANLILRGLGPTHIRIHVNRITVKALARIIWAQNTDRLVSLDLSNMNLSDTDGSYIARALKNNAILKRLNVSENLMGSKTCAVFADSLTSNKSLESLTLDSNPLCKNDCDGFCLFVSMLQENKGLRCVGIWRCQTGAALGKSFARAVEGNSNLLSVDVGYNSWCNKDLQCIQNALQRNRKLHKIEQEHRDFELVQQQEQIEAERAMVEKENAKEVERQWLESQKLERAEARRIQMEKLAERKRSLVSH